MNELEQKLQTATQQANLDSNVLVPVVSSRKGIGSHQSANMKNDEWLTPPHIINALGNFDLDPCAPIIRPWDTATNHYTSEDNVGGMRSWGNRRYEPIHRH